MGRTPTNIRLCQNGAILSLQYRLHPHPEQLNLGSACKLLQPFAEPIVNLKQYIYPCARCFAQLDALNIIRMLDTSTSLVVHPENDRIKVPDKVMHQVLGTSEHLKFAS